MDRKECYISLSMKYGLINGWIFFILHMHIDIIISNRFTALDKRCKIVRTCFCLREVVSKQMDACSNFTVQYVYQNTQGMVEN